MKTQRIAQFILLLIAVTNTVLAQDSVPHHLPTLPSWKLVKITPEWIAKHPDRVKFGGKMLMGAEGIPDEYWMEFSLPEPSPYVIGAEFIATPEKETQDGSFDAMPFSVQTWCFTPSKTVRVVFHEMAPRSTKAVFSISLVKDITGSGRPGDYWSSTTFQIDFRQWTDLQRAHNRSRK